MSDRQKRALINIGTIVVVYVSIRYLLPLVVPFCIGFILARWGYPVCKRIHDTIHVPVAVAGGILIGLYTLFFLGTLAFLGSRIVEEGQQLAENMPRYGELVNQWVNQAMNTMEHTFHIQEGTLLIQAKDFLQESGGKILENVMTNLLQISGGMIGGAAEFATAIALSLVSGILWIQSYEMVAAWRKKSDWSREVNRILHRLGLVGSAYARTELLIMMLTMTVCMAGLSLMGNSYGILLGVFIGLFDALPLFGSGMVFIPWIIIELINGNFGTAGILGLIYGICYFLREILEAKLLGDRIGITPIASMISMYVGWCLFGIIGLFLGPAGYLVIREVDDIYRGGGKMAKTH